MLLVVCTSVMAMVWVFSIIHKQILQPDLSIFFSLKNELREFDKRSKYFLVSDHFTYSHHLSPDCLLISLGEN